MQLRFGLLFTFCMSSTFFLCGMEGEILLGPKEAALKSALFVHDGDLRYVLSALGSGADANARMSMLGDTPLHVAVAKKKLPLIVALLRCGADVNQKNDLGFTPLHMAVRVNDLLIVRLLCALGADPTAKGKRGITPAHFLQDDNPDGIGPELEKQRVVNEEMKLSNECSLCMKEYVLNDVRNTMQRRLTVPCSQWYNSNIESRHYCCFECYQKHINTRGERAHLCPFCRGALAQR